LRTQHFEQYCTAKPKKNKIKNGRRFYEGERKERVAAHRAARIVSCELFSEESQGVQAGRRLCHYCVGMND